MRGLDHDSSVKLSALLILHKADVRDFLVASIMGTWVSVSGHRGPLRGGERAIATTVNRTERAKIRDALGIKNKTWQNKMSRWAKLDLAHNCSTTSDCLFVEPLGGSAAPCPGCSRSLGLSLGAGTNLPPVRETHSPSAGTSGGEISGTTSNDGDSSNKVVLRGGEEGGSGVHAQEPRLTPDLAREELKQGSFSNRRS